MLVILAYGLIICLGASPCDHVFGPKPKTTFECTNTNAKKELQNYDSNHNNLLIINVLKD